jgi:hypothetical protein
MIEWINESRKHINVIWNGEFCIRIGSYGMLLNPGIVEKLGNWVTFGFDKKNNNLIIKIVGKDFPGSYRVGHMAVHRVIKSLRVSRWLQEKGLTVNTVYQCYFNEEKNQFETEIIGGIDG